MLRVKKAVIPVAGLGTRFLPATKSIPKELVTIVDRPCIQYVVEEAMRAGIREIVFVNARHKEAIENHFDSNFEIEQTLLARGKKELAKQSSEVGEGAVFISVRQKNPLGLGHAILCAQPVVGNEPFAVLLGDDLMDSDPPCIGELLEVYERTGKSTVAVMEVPRDQVNKYGIVAPKGGLDGKVFEVASLVEKPNPEAAPSCWAIPGRYVLSSQVFESLKVQKAGALGEIQLTDSLDTLAKRGELLASVYQGRRYDAGDRLGYLEATLAFALKRPDLRAGIERLIRQAYSELEPS